MTDVENRSRRATARRLSFACALPIALVALAMLTAMSDAPWAIRVLAVPVLIVIPGAALVALLLGEREDPAVALPLTVLLGLLLWLIVSLLLHLTGTRINATSLAIGVGAVGLLTTIERQRRRVRDHEQFVTKLGPVATIPAEVAHRIRAACTVIGAIAAIVVAIVVAEAIQPPHVERYTSLGFTDTSPFADGHDDADRGGQVRLNWTLRGYGYDLSASSAAVRLTVDGSPVDDIAIDINLSTAPDIPEATSTIAGAVTFAAPRQPGRHVVALTVVPAASDGTTLPAPGFITTVLEVK